MGRLKYPSSAHSLKEDACALWLHSSTILGLAVLGEAADAMVGLCCVGIYRTIPRVPIPLNIYIESSVEKVFILAKIC